MSDRTESMMAVLAAVLVLFTSMLDPRISAGLAVVLMIAFAVYKFIKNQKSHKAYIEEKPPAHT